MSEYEKKWGQHLQASVHAGNVILQAKLGAPHGESFVLTPQEMRDLLDLFSQNRHALINESAQGPLDDLMVSFAYQRDL